MIPLTQTKVHIPGEQRGNCMAACVASILELPIEALPEVNDVEAAGWHFTNVLNSYLAVHHGLTYATLADYQITAVRIPGYHIIGGPTVRTPASGVEHAVVGWDGRMVWDPHPSRAGLTEVRDWSVLAPIPAAKRADWWAGSDRHPCLCPACGGARPHPKAG